MLLQSVAFDLPAYLARIGFSGTARADLPTLRAICRLHPMAIAFENLTPLRGRPVSLDLTHLQDKLIARHRGGYCYEQNTVLAHALAAIGFPVEGLAARVLWGAAPDAPTPPQTHMLLRVRADGRDWIADAGFGGLTPTAPLLIQPGIAQDTPHETFRLHDMDGDLLLEARIGAEWRPVYRSGTAPRSRSDYELANYWVSTNPQSQFTRTLITSRPVEGGRLTLNGLNLSEYRAGETPQRRTLSVEATEVALETQFGLTLPDRANLRLVLENLSRTAN